MNITLPFSKRAVPVNRVIVRFIIADLIFFGGWGFMAPVFSIFIIQTIPGATLITVGAATAVYWIVKSLFQLPVALFLDRHPGERDDFYALVTGLLLAGIAALLFLTVHSVTGVITVAALQGLAFGLYTPSWSALFARHLDRTHFSFDWSLDSTSVGLASGIAGLVGGAVAATFGFPSIFIVTAVLSFLSVLILLAIPRLVFPESTTRSASLIRDHTPVNINR